MPATRSTLAIARRQARSYRAVERRTEKVDIPARSTTSELIIDSKGIITACPDVLLRTMGATKEEVVGNNVRSLIPALPFQAATEGYNIAYARFSAAQKESRIWVVSTHDGRRIEVAGCIALQRTPTGYAIRMTICTSMPRPRTPAHENRTLAPAFLRIPHASHLPAW